MNWSNTGVDHVMPFCLFDVSKDEQLKEAFNWRNTQPLLKKFISKKELNIISKIINYNSLGLINF